MMKVFRIDTKTIKKTVELNTDCFATWCQETVRVTCGSHQAIGVFLQVSPKIHQFFYMKNGKLSYNRASDNRLSCHTSDKAIFKCIWPYSEPCEDEVIVEILTE